MNNKATLFLSIVTSVMFFFAGMLLMNFILPEVSIAEGVSGMNCDATDLSDGSKMTCLGMDFVVPYFILAILSVFAGRIIDNLI